MKPYVASFDILHRYRLGRDLPLLGTAGGIVVRVTGGVGILPGAAVGLEKLQDAKGKSQERVPVLVHSEILPESRKFRSSSCVSCR